MPSSLTYNDTLAAYQNYPAPIRPFLLRAETHPTLRSQLTKSFMRVFIDILGRAPIADPLRPLWLRNDIVAENLNISTKTVSRALHFLKQKAWINPYTEDDGRNNWGQFNANKFLLGEELRTLLGLPTVSINQKNTTTNSPAPPTSSVVESVSPAETIIAPCTDLPEAVQVPCFDTPQIADHKDSAQTSEACPDETRVNEPTETKMSHGLYTVNNVFLKEASFEQGASDTKPEPQKTKGKAIHLPKSLLPLQQELGIDPRGIFKLMSIAKKVKQRLQDVWIAKRDHLLTAGATGGRAFKYLKFLLETGEDFAFRAQNAGLKKTTAPAKSHPSILATEPAVTDHRRYWNKRFVGDNGLQVRIHGDGSAAVTNATEANAYVRPADVTPIYEAIAAGRLWLLEE